MMRRLVEEELYLFDGTPLFPERRAYTVCYGLSPGEGALYEAVTRYVREEMNRADRFAEDGTRRRNNVGFALQILQRRLASSPAAIHESLKRRLARLGDRLEEERLARAGGGLDARIAAEAGPAVDQAGGLSPRDAGRPLADDAHPFGVNRHFRPRTISWFGVRALLPLGTDFAAGIANRWVEFRLWSRRPASYSFPAGRIEKSPCSGGMP